MTTKLQIFLVLLTVFSIVNAEIDRRRHLNTHDVSLQRIRLLENLFKQLIKIKLDELDSEDPVFESEETDDDPIARPHRLEHETRQQKTSALLDRLRNKVSLLDYD